MTSSRAEFRFRQTFALSFSSGLFSNVCQQTFSEQHRSLWLCLLLPNTLYRRLIYSRLIYSLKGTLLLHCDRSRRFGADVLGFNFCLPSVRLSTAVWQIKYQLKVSVCIRGNCDSLSYQVAYIDHVQQNNIDKIVILAGVTVSFIEFY